MMPLRIRFIVSGLVAMLLLIGFVTLVVGERQAYNKQLAQLDQNHNAGLLARDLGLYTEYSADDMNAYMLGHPDQHNNFTTHTKAFARSLGLLEHQAAIGMLDDDTTPRLVNLRHLQSDYFGAAEQLFTATDAWRAAPSTTTQATMDGAWTKTDALSNQLNASSESLAADFQSDTETLQHQLEARGAFVLTLLSAGGVGIGLILLATQLLSARAIGRPIVNLIDGVERFRSGDYTVRVDGRRRDEIGDLGRAFNSLADTIEQQTAQLNAQYRVAETSRAEAEAAREEVVEQLATIRQQEQIIREMTVPILPVDSDTLVMPLIGALDTKRLQDTQHEALRALEQTRSRQLLLDITGVPVVDTYVAGELLRLIQAARLLGAQVMLIGVRPEVAQSMVALGVELPDLRSERDLQSALRSSRKVRGRG